MSLRHAVLVTLVTSLAAVPAATVVTLAASDAALAKNSHGGGSRGKGGGGKGGSKDSGGGGGSSTSSGGGPSAGSGGSLSRNTSSGGGGSGGGSHGSNGSFIDLKPGSRRSDVVERSNRVNRTASVRRAQTPRNLAVARSLVPPQRPGSPIPEPRPTKAGDASPKSAEQIAIDRVASLEHGPWSDDPDYQAELDSFRLALLAYVGESAAPEAIESALAAFSALAEEDEFDRDAAESILADLYLEPQPADHLDAPLVAGIIQVNETGEEFSQRSE